MFIFRISLILHSYIATLHVKDDIESADIPNSQSHLHNVSSVEKEKDSASDEESKSTSKNIENSAEIYTTFKNDILEWDTEPDEPELIPIQKASTSANNAAVNELATSREDEAPTLEAAAAEQIYQTSTIMPVVHIKTEIVSTSGVGTVAEDNVDDTVSVVNLNAVTNHNVGTDDNGGGQESVTDDIVASQEPVTDDNLVGQESIIDDIVTSQEPVTDDNVGQDSIIVASHEPVTGDVVASQNPVTDDNVSGQESVVSGSSSQVGTGRKGVDGGDMVASSTASLQVGLAETGKNQTSTESDSMEQTTDAAKISDSNLEATSKVNVKSSSEAESSTEKVTFDIAETAAVEVATVAELTSIILKFVDVLNVATKAADIYTIASTIQDSTSRLSRNTIDKDTSDMTTNYITSKVSTEGTVVSETETGVHDGPDTIVNYTAEVTTVNSRQIELLSVEDSEVNDTGGMTTENGNTLNDTEESTTETMETSSTGMPVDGSTVEASSEYTVLIPGCFTAWQV